MRNHNLKGRAARRKAMEEAVRVLRSGGRMMIAAIFAARQYQADLTTLGLAGITRRSLGWRLWWSGPWLATHLVCATKPESKSPQSG